MQVITKVFISSTSSDLINFRSKVITAVSQLKCTPICMEHEAPKGGYPLDECLKMVRNSDVYVGIFAWHYGFVPSRKKRSITELEYREAVKNNKPTFIFLLDESAEWPQEYRDSGDPGKRIQRLRNELMHSHWLGMFTTEDNLAKGVAIALANYLRGREFEGARKPTEEDALKNQEGMALLAKKQKEADELRRMTTRRRIVPFLTRECGNFQDRLPELADLHQYLADGNLRVVLICGRGGIGKTQLLRKFLNEVAATMTDRASSVPSEVDGMVILDLTQREYRSPERIDDFITSTLPPEPAQALKETWRTEGTPLQERLALLFLRILARHRCLIVLDNLESVLDSDGRMFEEYGGLRKFIEACLEYDHKALIIATSRRTLSLSPHVEAQIIGRKAQLPLEVGLQGEDAINLLRDMDPDGRHGIKNAPRDLLDQIVHRCMGIPRTLETLVGTLRGKPTWSLKTLLVDEVWFKSLVEDPARELFASLQSEKEQVVVQCLAVYQQYENAVPAVAVRHMLPALPVEDILDKLYRNYVVAYDGSRFSLHPLDQEYAYCQLPDSNPGFSKQRLHALAAEFYKALCRPKIEWKAIDDIEPQLRQFRHLVRASQFDEACSVLNEIDREYLAQWGQLALVIELRLQLIGHITDGHLEALNLGNLGVAYFDSGQNRVAIEYYEKALPMFRELGMRKEEGRFLGNRGLARIRLGEFKEGEQGLVQGLEIAREIGDRMHEGRWLGNLAYIRRMLGRITLEEAASIYKQAIGIAKEVEDHRFERIWSEYIGDIYFTLGNLREAETYYKQASDAAERMGARRQECFISLKLGNVYARLGEPQKQLQCSERASKLLGYLERPEDQTELNIQLGTLFGEMGQTEKQIDCYEKALTISTNLHKSADQQYILLILSGLYEKLGLHTELKRANEDLLAITREASDRPSEATALIRLGDTYVSLRQANLAIKHYEDALAIAQELGDYTGKAVISYRLARVLMSVGKTEKAIEYYKFTLLGVRELKDYSSELLLVNLLGIGYWNLNNPDTAIEYYKEALSIARRLEDKDNEAVELFNIGDAYHLSGDVTAAIPYYEEALALDQPSSNFKAASGLGVAGLQLGEPDKARAHFERCINLCCGEPEKSKTLHPRCSALGQSLIAIGRTDEGLQTYQRGLETKPSREELNYSIKDLENLRCASPDIPGLAEAIGILTEAFNHS